MYDTKPGQSPPPEGTIADPAVTPEDAEATEDSTGFTSLRDDITALVDDARTYAEAEIALQRLELLVERRRHEMVKASQERQLLDKLKEKQAERHAHEQEIKEQNNLDEIASIRHEAQVV